MADRHTAQTVLAALAALGRTVTDTSDTSARVDGVRLEFSRTRCRIDNWTLVELGANSQRGRTIERIVEAIDAAVSRGERRRQAAAEAAEWSRLLALSESLTAHRVIVRARLDRTFTITVSPVDEAALTDLVALIRTRLGDDHA